MPKIKKSKKDDFVEVKPSKSSKSISTSDVIKKVVDTDDVVVSRDPLDDDDNRNPEMGEDGVITESLDGVADDSGITSDEEAIQIYRDVMTMSEEDRNSDTDNKLAPLRLYPPPPPMWSDDRSKLKFKVGEFVRYKGHPEGNSYKVCGPGVRVNSFSIKGSGSRDTFEENGEKLIKVTEKDAKWVDYWSQFPVIPAPKPWLKKEEKIVEKPKKTKRK